MAHAPHTVRRRVADERDAITGDTDIGTPPRRSAAFRRE